MAKITITIKDDIGLSENEIFDKIEDCVEYEPWVCKLRN